MEGHRISVDLWVLLSRHRSLREYLDLFEKKFEARDIGHVVRALVHFDDADSEPPLRLLVDIDWDKVKERLQESRSRSTRKRQMRRAGPDRRVALLVCASLWAALSAPSSEAQEPLTAEEDKASSSSADVPQFGGPSSVAGRLSGDAEPKESYYRYRGLERGLGPWFEMKDRLADKRGFSFGIDYSALYQSANESFGGGEDRAAGGILELPMSWTLFDGKDGSTGTLVFKTDHGHRLGTEVAPEGLGAEVGAASLTGSGFGDFDLAVINLYWQQSFNDGRLTYIAGRVDPSDYVDFYPMVDTLTAFTNQVFSNSPTIALPSPGFGGGFAVFPTENWYAIAGFSDTNGQPTTSGLDSFFNQNEYFKHLEIGHISSFERRQLDNTHLTLWHSDARRMAGVGEGWGGTFSFSRFLGDRLLPFVRAGWGDGGGDALMEGLVSAGFGLLRKSHDLFGLGLSWGRPSEATFGPDLDDQITAEVFYRVTLSPRFAVTPDVQILLDPALNPNEDTILFFGLRARLTL